MHSIQKEASEIGVGDIVFCQVQRSQQYYAHIGLEVERDYHAQEPKYWIGNSERKIKGPEPKYWIGNSERALFIPSRL